MNSSRWWNIVCRTINLCNLNALISKSGTFKLVKERRDKVFFSGEFRLIFVRTVWMISSTARGTLSYVSSNFFRPFHLTPPRSRTEYICHFSIASTMTHIHLVRSFIHTQNENKIFFQTFCLLVAALRQTNIRVFFTYHHSQSLSIRLRSPAVTYIRIPDTTKHLQFCKCVIISTNVLHELHGIDIGNGVRQSTTNSKHKQNKSINSSSANSRGEAHTQTHT